MPDPDHGLRVPDHTTPSRVMSPPWRSPESRGSDPRHASPGHGSRRRRLSYAGTGSIPRVERGAFTPVYLSTASSCFRERGPATAVRLRHRSSGMWLRFPESRCATRCDFTSDYSMASDLYVCFGEVGDLAGCALQSAADGRMLSAHSTRRTWSPSPPRRRGRGADPTQHMEELHLHIRRFTAAEVVEYTDYSEIRFAGSDQYVATPALQHALHVSVKSDDSNVSLQEEDPCVNCLWLTTNRLEAQSWDIYQSHPAFHRRCRWCAQWYDSQEFGRCPESHNAQHESFLLPEWAAYDSAHRDEELRASRAATKSLPAGLLAYVFSYLGAESVPTVALVCSQWLHLLDGVSGEHAGNREWAMGCGFVAASRACSEDVSLLLRGRAHDRERRICHVVRHAATVAAPKAYGIISEAQSLPWDERSDRVSNTSLSTGGHTSRRALRGKTAEGACVAALVFRKVETALSHNALPCDVDSVDAVASALARSMTVYDMVKSFEQPAKLHSAVYMAAAKVGLTGAEHSALSRTTSDIEEC